jgi:hypothetical protein
VRRTSPRNPSFVIRLLSSRSSCINCDRRPKVASVIRELWERLSRVRLVKVDNPKSVINVFILSDNPVKW